MTLGEGIPIFGNWFFIHFVENSGMAFGMKFGGSYGKLFLSLFRIAAVGAIAYYLWTLIRSKAKTGLVICLSFILAGAIGNIIDSAFYGMIFGDSLYHVTSFMPQGGGYGTFLHGRVVDMLYFPVIQTTFPNWVPFWGGEEFVFFRPVFNIADSSISMGVITLILFQKRFFAKPQEKSENTEEATDNQKSEEVTPEIPQ